MKHIRNIYEIQWNQTSKWSKIDANKSRKVSRQDPRDHWRVKLLISTNFSGIPMFANLTEQLIR